MADAWETSHSLIDQADNPGTRDFPRRDDRLLGGAKTEESWYDNRPGEKDDPGFRRSILAALLAIFVPGTVAIYFAPIMAGGSATLGLLLALILGVGGFLACYAAITLSNRDLATAVRFETTQMVWRTRDGRILKVAFSEVVQIVPSTWKGDLVGGEVRRYAVVMNPGRLGLRRGIWLNPENKARLEALRRPQKTL